MRRGCARQGRDWQCCEVQAACWLLCILAMPSDRATAHWPPPIHRKSTLLDLLAGRKTAGRLVEGSSIQFNGRRPTSTLLRRDGGGQGGRRQALCCPTMKSCFARVAGSAAD